MHSIFTIAGQGLMKFSVGTMHLLRQMGVVIIKQPTDQTARSLDREYIAQHRSGLHFLAVLPRIVDRFFALVVKMAFRETWLLANGQIDT